MGLNITHTMNTFQFEHKENLRNTAKNILTRQGASSETMQKIFEQSVFPTYDSRNPQLAILKASSQISINNNLKETLKYLKTQALKKEVKKPILGELWNSLDEIKEEYKGELIDFVVDESLENIFAA